MSIEDLLEITVPQVAVLELVTSRLIKRYHHYNRLRRQYHHELEYKDYNDQLAMEGEVDEIHPSLYEQVKAVYECFPDDKLLPLLGKERHHGR